MTAGLVPKACRECGGQSNRRGEFCSRKCKATFANRQAVRGAQLYPLFMASRYALGEAKSLKVWREMNRLAAAWKAEDDAAGRVTWKPPGQVLARLQDDGRLPRGELLCRNYRAGR